MQASRKARISGGGDPGIQIFAKPRAPPQQPQLVRPPDSATEAAGKSRQRPSPGCQVSNTTSNVVPTTSAGQREQPGLWGRRHSAAGPSAALADSFGGGSFDFAATAVAESLPIVSEGQLAGLRAALAAPAAGWSAQTVSEQQGMAAARPLPANPAAPQLDVAAQFAAVSAAGACLLHDRTVGAIFLKFWWCRKFCQGPESFFDVDIFGLD